ncbi:MAG TPA: bifunctional glutamate N-acetyltransferase/amino-acid acetyltransferase ArgJ [Pseudogracilibacillus sp.]|nr:bifunctional glutamate N-acetyltransferase/amino-acid acetyltransferase ArgJ [Pseudogracilibacillus sp.]
MQEEATSAIQQVQNGSIITPEGFQAGGLHSGVKRKRNDLGIIYSNHPANAAAVYTLNQVRAIPLEVTRSSIAREGKLQAIIANSGNANACTGAEGKTAAYNMQQTTADTFDIPAHLVAVASTGVIGEPMPTEKIIPAIDRLEIGDTTTNAADFGEAILTTDTFSKNSCYQTTINNQVVTMGGSAKGSGMIEPNMGTMLAFLTTDAVISQAHLQTALDEIIGSTFNCITVDGDTSTNDMVITMANEQAGNQPLSPAHPEWETFVDLMRHVAEDLSKQIARDGEGATKLIEVEVAGAAHDKAAKQIAKTIVGSSLVKSAVFGSDANWGRIICAIGYSGELIDPEQIDMQIGPISLLQNSTPVAFSEKEAKTYLEKDTIHIYADLHVGKGTGKAWGCDLTYDYVSINANYRS